MFPVVSCFQNQTNRPLVVSADWNSHSVDNSICPQELFPYQGPDKPCGRLWGRCHIVLSPLPVGTPHSSPGGRSHTHHHLQSPLKEQKNKNKGKKFRQLMYKYFLFGFNFDLVQKAKFFYIKLLEDLKSHMKIHATEQTFYFSRTILPTFLLLFSTLGFLLRTAAAAGAIWHWETPIIKVTVSIRFIFITLIQRKF